MNIDKRVQEAYTFVLLQFKEHGSGPHYLDLADHFKLDTEAARQLLWDAAEVGTRTGLGASTMSHDTDYIESWAPFSSIPTHHRITVDGEQKWYGQ